MSAAPPRSRGDAGRPRFACRDRVVLPPVRVRGLERSSGAGFVAAALVAAALALAPAPDGARAQGQLLEEIEGADADLDVDLDEAPRARGATGGPRIPPSTSAGSTAGASSSSARASGDRGGGDRHGGEKRAPAAGDAAPSSDADDVPPSIVGVEVLPFSFDGLLERWDARRVAHAGADPVARARADSVLEEGLRSYGVQGVRGGLGAIDFANALVAEADRKREQGELDDALELTAFATRAAPDLPLVYASAARVKLASSDIPGALASLVEWGQALMREPTSRVLTVMGALTVGLLAVLFVLLLVSLLFLVRSFRFLAFDLHNALPRGAARWQLQLLVVLLAALPVVTASGPVIAALWWLTLAWVYLSRREQLVVAALALLLVVAPFAVEALSVLWSWPGSRLANAYDASYDAGARDAARAIEALSPSERTLRERAVLASRLKREGRIDEAYEAWRRIVQEAPEQAWAHNNLAVVAALVGKEDHAIAELEAAISRDPGATEAAFNLAQIHLRHRRQDKAEKLLAPIEQRAPGRLEAYRTQTFRAADRKVDQNRAFVDAALPSTPLEDLYRSPQPGAAALEREVAGIAYFGLPPSFAAALVGLFVLSWIVLLRVRARLQPSQPCVKCGSAASRRYDADEVPRGMCSACYHAFLNPRARIEAGMKLRKERQVSAYRRRYGTTLAMLTLLCPGAGHLYGGAAISGTLLALAFSVVLGAGVLVIGPLPWPHLTDDLPVYALAALLGLVLVTLYAIAARTVGRLAGR